MYYDVYSRMRNMRLIPISVEADGSMTVESRHVTVAKLATGQYGITLDRSAQQDLFILPTTRTDGVARHIAQVPKANLAAGSGRVYTYDFSDVAADAPFDALLVASDGRGNIFEVMQNLVYCALKKPRMMTLYYDGVNGTLFGRHGYDVSVEKTGTGLYTITVRRPFQQEPIVIVGTSASTRVCEVATKSGSTITLEAVNASSGAAADAELTILIFGSDARQIYSKNSHVLKCPQPFTFLNPFEFNGTAGTMTRASASYSLTKNGAGDYTVTRRKPFPRAGFGICTTGGAAVSAGINTRTNAAFNVAAEADTAAIYGLDIGYARGRD